MFDFVRLYSHVPIMRKKTLSAVLRPRHWLLRGASDRNRESAERSALRSARQVVWGYRDHDLPRVRESEPETSIEAAYPPTRRRLPGLSIGRDAESPASSSGFWKHRRDESVRG